MISAFTGAEGQRRWGSIGEAAITECDISVIERADCFALGISVKFSIASLSIITCLVFVACT